jgi:hypothetical protein
MAASRTVKAGMSMPSGKKVVVITDNYQNCVAT